MTSGALYHRVTTYLFSLLGFHFVLVVVAPSQSQVADFYIAGFVEKNVRRFEVAMDDVRRVHEEHRPEDLVDKIVDMLLGELLLRVDDPMKVGLHELSNDVDIVESLRVLRL